MSSLRLAFRSFAKAPGFTAIAVLTLALGISMSVSSFSIANLLVFRTLPFRDPDSLVALFRTAQQSPNLSHSPGNFLDLRSRSQSFSSLAAYNFGYASFVPKDQPARQLQAMSVTANFLSTLGIQPMLGRDFAPDDDQPGKEPVVILSQRLWERQLGSDPAVIGKSLRIDGRSYTVVGILPNRFHVISLWGRTDMIRPLTLWPNFRNERAGKWFHLVGRLQEGTNPAQAQKEIEGIIAGLNKDYPKENNKDGIRLEALSAAFVGQINTGLSYLIVGLSCMVLFIACANLASIQIARAFERSRDYAIRSALGANKLQLMKPLLVESLLLSLGGGTLGLVFALWTNALVGQTIIINNEPGIEIPLDGKVLAFAIIASVSTVVLSGLAPAWFASRHSGADGLKDGSRGATSGSVQLRAKYALVIGEVALALVLVCVAASFSLSLRSFFRRDLGWQPSGLVGGTLSLPYDRYPNDEKRLRFYQDLLDKAKALPGVEQAALIANLPVFDYFNNQNILIEGQAEPTPGTEAQASLASVSPEALSMMKIPLRQGRGFDDKIGKNDPPYVLINESMANHFWPGQNALGKRLRLRNSQTWLEVIGIVGDVRMAVALQRPATYFQMYRPLIQSPTSYADIVVRGSGKPESYLLPLRRAVASLDADLPIVNGDHITRQIDLALANLNVLVTLLAFFAGMGLFIASLSVYGVVAQLTNQRTREFGVRIALGASSASIIGMTLRQSLWICVLGIGIGMLGAFGMNRFLASVMPEVGVPGLWIQISTGLILCATTLLACWLPARRAAAIDPVQALRAE